jgi:hypothetical protein
MKSVMKTMFLLTAFLASCATAESHESLSEGFGGACTVDADCRLESDYCLGCDCRALAKEQKLPKCTGPGVRCLLDPCKDKMAICKDARCTATAASTR